MITRLLSRPHRAGPPLDPLAPPLDPTAPPASATPIPTPNGQLTKQLQGSIQQFLRQERVITMASYTLIPAILIGLTLVFGLGYLRSATHAATSATATTTAVSLFGATSTTPTSSTTLVPGTETTTPTAVASPSATVAPTAAPKKTPTHAPAPPTPVATLAPQVVLAIDSGGSGVGIYQGDMDLSGGSSSTTTTTHPIDISLTGNATPANVYQTAREGASFAYTIDQLTPGASYTVLLDFAEIGAITGAGQRQFNVTINDQPALTNFDIVAQAGAPYKAIAQSFATTATTNGQITIAFQGIANVALVNGIEIVMAPTGA